MKYISCRKKNGYIIIETEGWFRKKAKFITDPQEHYTRNQKPVFYTYPSFKEIDCIFDSKYNELCNFLKRVEFESKEISCK